MAEEKQPKLYTIQTPFGPAEISEEDLQYIPTTKINSDGELVLSWQDGTEYNLSNSRPPNLFQIVLNSDAIFDLVKKHNNKECDHFFDNLTSEIDAEYNGTNFYELFEKFILKIKDKFAQEKGVIAKITEIIKKEIDSKEPAYDPQKLAVIKEKFEATKEQKEEQQEEQHFSPGKKI